MFTVLREIAARLRAPSRARHLDHDFDEELESHLTMLAEDNVRQGMTLEQARRAAAIRLGGVASLREQHRAARGLPTLESIWSDLRFTIRLIAKERWFSAAAVLVMALGIGVNAIGFTVVNAAFLRGLPLEDSHRLYVLAWQIRSGVDDGVSHTELQGLRRHNRTFRGLAAFSDGTINISDEHALPEQARGARITANTFRMLGQKVLLGRDFAGGEDHNGAEPAVIISYRLWKARYGADSEVIGQSLRVDGQPATIIGVMPDGMDFPSNTEVWVPFIPNETEQQRAQRVLSVFGRLRDETTREQAQSELDGIAQRFAVAYPEMSADYVGARVETFTERYVGGPARIVFLTMMGAVSFVLLIACGNVANLLLSRSARRTRELAMRLALGATRWRIVRQLLLESVVLSSLGGSIGLAIGIAGVRMLDAAVQDPDKPYWIVFTVDHVVFGYVAAICVLTGILFGLTPALHVSKTNINDVLKEGGRGTAGNLRTRWLSGTMVVVELALTLVLLAGAGLMMRSFMKHYALDLGIRTDQLMVMRLQLPESKYGTPESRRTFYSRLEPRITAIPGIDAVAMSTSVPPFAGSQQGLEIEGRPTRAPDAPRLNVSTVTVSPLFFDVLDVPLKRGRTFVPSDGEPGSETVIVNELLAARFFRGKDPIGRRIRLRGHDVTSDQLVASWRTIIGVSPTIRHGSRREGNAPSAVVYQPYPQEPPAGASLIVRSSLPPGSVMHAVRRALQVIDPDQPVFTIQTLDQMLAQDRWPFRVFGSLFASFAIIALLLSSVGLYGVMAYSVTQRTQEIGVRIALGADRSQTCWLVLRRGLTQVAMGLALGLAGAVVLSRVLRTALFQVTPTDAVTYAAITLLLTVVSITACLLPARRAMQVDPVVTLRAE